MRWHTRPKKNLKNDTTMLNQLKNPWSVGVIAFTVNSAVVYLVAPIFSIPVFGFNDGFDYLTAFWQSGHYMDMLTFLMPVIGAVGATSCVLSRNVGPHILSIAFSALPLMFMTYFIISMCKYPDIVNSRMETIPMVSVIGWGAWLSLAVSFLAFMLAITLVYTDYKSIKNH